MSEKREGYNFYKPKIGAILLAIGFLGMYLSWPIHLLIAYFGESEYKPSPVEFLTPIVLGILAIFLAWKSKEEELNKWTKLVLAVPPLLIALYFGGYMVIRLL
jgi:hypothetical protein